jgi:TolB-like protein
MKRILTIVVGGLFFLVIANLPLAAQQVVTEKDRVWAQRILENEESVEYKPEANTLAVLYFHNKTGKTTLDPLQKGFAHMLMADLSRVRNIRLTERVKLQALAEKMNFGVSGMVDSTAAPRLGRLLGARYLIEGELFSSTVAELGIRCSLVDLKEENIMGQPSAEGFLSGIVNMEKKILFEIIDLLEIKLSQSQIKRLEKPVTTRMDALFNVYRAINSCDRGEYKNARTYYMNALKEDPGLALAEDGLKELQRLNLITLKQKSHSMLSYLHSKLSTTDSILQSYSTRRSNDPGDLIKRESDAGGLYLEW